MLSHDKKFTLFFKSRKKAILARGDEFNYIVDYPQDLYILDNITQKMHPLIVGAFIIEFGFGSIFRNVKWVFPHVVGHILTRFSRTNK